MYRQPEVGQTRPCSFPEGLSIPSGGLETTLKVSPAAWQPRVLFCWLLSPGLAPAAALGVAPSFPPKPCRRFCLSPQTVHTARQGAGVEWLLSGWQLRAGTKNNPK